MSAAPAHTRLIAATVTVAIALVTVAAALYPQPAMVVVRERPPEDVSRHAQRAMRLWQSGDLGPAIAEFSEALRLKRRQAELVVEEL